MNPSATAASPSSAHATTPDQLAAAWEALRSEHPSVRTREAARRLGVSEMELLATGCGSTVRRLRSDVNDLLPRLEALGEVMALTRNDLFVHEKTGVYENPGLGTHASQIVGEDIDLRIFPASWRHAFAAEVAGRRGPLHSLQFFDAHGVAVHKIYRTENSDREAWEALVDELVVEDQSRDVQVEPPAGPAEPRPDAEVDAAALEAGWREMRDTHDFFGLLRTHGVARTQALRLVPDELARPAADDALHRILETASADGIDLMVFVRSPGTFQIHHGPVKRIVETGDWLNVMDPGFNLHARPDLVAATWIVRKPTETGWVTSVEFYDADDDLACLIFGCRKEGEPENPAWRTLAESLGG